MSPDLFSVVKYSKCVGGRGSQRSQEHLPRVRGGLWVGKGKEGRERERKRGIGTKRAEWEGKREVWTPASAPKSDSVYEDSSLKISYPAIMRINRGG